MRALFAFSLLAATALGLSDASAFGRGSVGFRAPVGHAPVLHRRNVIYPAVHPGRFYAGRAGFGHRRLHGYGRAGYGIGAGYGAYGGYGLGYGYDYPGYGLGPYGYGPGGYPVATRNPQASVITVIPGVPSAAGIAAPPVAPPVIYVIDGRPDATAASGRPGSRRASRLGAAEAAGAPEDGAMAMTGPRVVRLSPAR